MYQTADAVTFTIFLHSDHDNATASVRFFSSTGITKVTDTETGVTFEDLMERNVTLPVNARDDKLSVFIVEVPFRRTMAFKATFSSSPEESVVLSTGGQKLVVDTGKLRWSLESRMFGESTAYPHQGIAVTDIKVDLDDDGVIDDISEDITCGHYESVEDEVCQEWMAWVYDTEWHNLRSIMDNLVDGDNMLGFEVSENGPNLVEVLITGINLVDAAYSPSAPPCLISAKLTFFAGKAYHLVQTDWGTGCPNSYVQEFLIFTNKDQHTPGDAVEQPLLDGEGHWDKGSYIGFKDSVGPTNDNNVFGYALDRNYGWAPRNMVWEDDTCYPVKEFNCVTADALRLRDEFTDPGPDYHQELGEVFAISYPDGPDEHASLQDIILADPEGSGFYCVDGLYCEKDHTSAISLSSNLPGHDVILAFTGIPTDHTSAYLKADGAYASNIPQLVLPSGTGPNGRAVFSVVLGPETSYSLETAQADGVGIWWVETNQEFTTRVDGYGPAGIGSMMGGMFSVGEWYANGPLWAEVGTVAGADYQPTPPNPGCQGVTGWNLDVGALGHPNLERCYISIGEFSSFTSCEAACGTWTTDPCSPEVGAIYCFRTREGTHGRIKVTGLGTDFVFNYQYSPSDSFPGTPGDPDSLTDHEGFDLSSGNKEWGTYTYSDFKVNSGNPPPAYSEPGFGRYAFWKGASQLSRLTVTGNVDGDTWSTAYVAWSVTGQPRVIDKITGGEKMAQWDDIMEEIKISPAAMDDVYVLDIDPADTSQTVGLAEVAAGDEEWEGGA